MKMTPGASDNYGPHCRNCHSGASSCNQCHGPGMKGYTATTNAPTAGLSPFYPNSYVATEPIAVVGGINGQCVDGGFSFPHRTLGAEMLKDSLFGVDFDGQPIAFGATRGSASSGSVKDQALFAAGFIAPSTYPAGSVAPTSNPLPFGSITNNSLSGQAVENLDSVCIDCHGHATYWHGNPGDPLSQELLLKGLP